MKNPFSKILINTAPAPSPIRSKIPSVWPMQRPSNNIYYIKPTFDSRKNEDLGLIKANPRYTVTGFCERIITKFFIR